MLCPLRYIGSRSSYASEAITYLVKIDTIRKEYKTIEALTNSTTTKLKNLFRKTARFEKWV